MTGATWRTRSVCALLSPKARFKLGLPLESTPGRLSRAGFISRVWANVAIPLRRTSPTPAGAGTRGTQRQRAHPAQIRVARSLAQWGVGRGTEGPECITETRRRRRAHARTARIGAFEHLQAA